MKRPFYVYTPRNKYGENLAHYTGGYEIRAVHTGRQAYAKIEDRSAAEAEAKRRNDAHEVELACAMYI